MYIKMSNTLLLYIVHHKIKETWVIVFLVKTHIVSEPVAVAFAFCILS